MGENGWIALFAVLGYFSGTIPFGLLLTRAFGLGDLRSIGSGNIGATNALRTGNKTLALLTLLGDMLKGTVPVLVGWRWGWEAAAAAGLGAFVGHLFPVWLGFKGGKGVATYLGVALGVAPLAALAFAAVWLLLAAVFRYSSLAALGATLLVPLACLLLLRDPHAAALMAALSVLVWIKHRPNILRLLAGTEGRIGAKG